MMIKPLPIQPLEEDSSGVIRFVKNRIVTALVETSTLDMYSIALLDVTNEERTQFAQLIGYSLSGFGDLSYVANIVYETSEKMAGGETEKDAKIQVLEAKLAKIKCILRELLPEIFSIHPDDLD